MSAYDAYDSAPDAVIRYRFKEMLRDVTSLLSWRRDVDLKQQAHASELAQQGKDIALLGKKLDRLNGTLNKLLLTVVGGSTGIVFSVLLGTGKL